MEPDTDSYTTPKNTVVANGDEMVPLTVTDNVNKDILELNKNETIDNANDEQTDDDIPSRIQTNEKNVGQTNGNNENITNNTKETAGNIVNSMTSLSISTENKNNIVVNENEALVNENEVFVNKEEALVNKDDILVNGNYVSLSLASNNEEEKQSENNLFVEKSQSLISPCDNQNDNISEKSQQKHDSLHNGFETHEEEIKINDEQTRHTKRELPSVDTALSSSLVSGSEDVVTNESNVLTELSEDGRKNESESICDTVKSSITNDAETKCIDEEKVTTSDGSIYDPKTVTFAKENQNEESPNLNGLQLASETVAKQEPAAEPMKTSSHRFSRQFSSSDSEGDCRTSSHKANNNKNSLSLSLDRELNPVLPNPYELHSPKGTPTGDRNVVHVVKLASRHRRQGSNVSIASLTERCREIQGEAVEHHTPVKAPLKEAGDDDTLEANLQPSNEPQTVEHQQQHNDDSEDEDGKLYPASPFPPPQTNAHQSIYSQRSMSLSEFSLEQTQELLGDEDERLLEDMMEYDRIDVQNDLIESIDSITDVEDNDSPVDIITEPGSKSKIFETY